MAINGVTSSKGVNFKGNRGTTEVNNKAETGEIKDGTKKVLLALGGLAVIGAAIFLVSRGKHNQASNAAHEAANAGQKANSATPKAPKKKPSAPKASAKGKAQASAGSALTGAEKMKNYTGEITRTAKDGSKIVAHFENGKPVLSEKTLPDGETFVKKYIYEDSKLKEVADFTRAGDHDLIKKRTVFTPNKGHTVFVHSDITGKDEIASVLSVKADGVLPFDSDISIMKPKKFGDTVTKYYKNGANTHTEYVKPEISADKFSFAKAGSGKCREIVTKDHAAGTEVRKLVYDNGHTDTLLSGYDFNSDDMELVSKDKDGSVLGYFKRTFLSKNSDKSDAGTIRRISNVQEQVFDSEHKPVSSCITKNSFIAPTYSD